MRTTLVLVAFVAASCFAALGQTSLEYSTIGSGAAAGASKAGGIASNALGEVDNRLTNAVNPSSPSTTVQHAPASTENSIRSNREVLDQQATVQGCGMLHISSVPKAATLYLDHLAVAATPADLCLPLGKHIVELKSSGFKTWSQEVTITQQAALSFAPKLSEEKQTKEYKRTVNVSF